MLKMLLLSWFTLVIVLALNGCKTAAIVVPDTEACTVAGVIAAGAMCSNTVSTASRDMTMDQFFDWLEPVLDAPDVPGHGGAICESANDWNHKKTTLEQACRILGSSCTYEMHQMIDGMSKVLEISQKQMQSKMMIHAIQGVGK